MDKELLHGLIVGLCTTVLATGITAYFGWKVASAKTSVETRTQAHVEEKDEAASEQQLTDRYRRIADDETARANREKDRADRAEAALYELRDRLGPITVTATPIEPDHAAIPPAPSTPTEKTP